MSSIRPPRLLLAALALVLVATACDATGRKASYANISRSYSVFALTGAPVNGPTALSLLGGATIADANFGFDVAFDIDASGATRLYPVRSLASAFAPGTQRVGLQVVPGSFESLTEAPQSGYDTLTAKVVTKGSVVAVEVQDLRTCLYSANGTNIYGKLVIDSIRLAERRIFGRSVVDVNCGFRELRPDTIPER
jgi:hypothetical protein